jgi:hypothetical protein
MAYCKMGVHEREKGFLPHIFVSKTPFGIPHISFNAVGILLHT